MSLAEVWNKYKHILYNGLQNSLAEACGNCETYENINVYKLFWLRHMKNIQKCEQISRITN